ncbi:MAG: PAS domain-containing protein, partial [Desulfovibrio sp.]|nr:PAS domain-containing protein [Desulfovibrio sp.]
MQPVSGLPQADTSFISQLMDILSDGLFMVDTAGRICEVNGSLCRLMGYERHELLGQPCSVLGCDACATVRLDDVEHWCTLFEQKLVMRRRCHFRHKNGTRIPVLKNARLVTASPASAGQGE